MAPMTRYGSAEKADAKVLSCKKCGKVVCECKDEKPEGKKSER